MLREFCQDVSDPWGVQKVCALCGRLERCRMPDIQNSPETAEEGGKLFYLQLELFCLQFELLCLQSVEALLGHTFPL